MAGRRLCIGSSHIAHSIEPFPASVGRRRLALGFARRGWKIIRESSDVKNDALFVYAIDEKNPADSTIVSAGFDSTLSLGSNSPFPDHCYQLATAISCVGIGSVVRALLN